LTGTLHPSHVVDQDVTIAAGVAKVIVGAIQPLSLQQRRHLIDATKLQFISDRVWRRSLERLRRFARGQQSIEVVRRNLTAGDGTVEHVHKVKLIDKGRMHELLARHVGLFEPEPLPASTVPAFVFIDCPGVAVH